MCTQQALERVRVGVVDREGVVVLEEEVVVEAVVGALVYTTAAVEDCILQQGDYAAKGVAVEAVVGGVVVVYCSADHQEEGASTFGYRLWWCCWDCSFHCRSSPSVVL